MFLKLTFYIKLKTVFQIEPKDACNELISATKGYPSADNITIIIMHLFWNVN